MMNGHAHSTAVAKPVAAVRAVPPGTFGLRFLMYPGPYFAEIERVLSSSLPEKALRGLISNYLLWLDLDPRDSGTIGGILRDTNRNSEFALKGLAAGLTARGDTVKHVNPLGFMTTALERELEEIRGIRNASMFMIGKAKWEGAWGNDGFRTSTGFRFVEFDMNGELRGYLHVFADRLRFNVADLERLLPRGADYDRQLASLRPLNPQSAAALPFQRAASAAWAPFLDFIVDNFKPAAARK